MTDEISKHNPTAGRIEGGIDAVVIGACADGLAAAATLGKAGLHTVLLGAAPEIGGPVQRREFAPGAAAIDGEHLISQLDPEVISELELYKHGVEYAARRLDTAYFFEDGPVINVEGDLSRASLSPDIAALADAEKFQAFIDDALEAAAILGPALGAPAYNGPGARAVLDDIIHHAGGGMEQRLLLFAASSVDGVLAPVFGDGPLRDMLTAETAFRAGAAPHEPFSFLNLIKRWSGEASGLVGAVAYPAGGAAAVIAALRRAVQAAKVDIRTSTQVKSIILERDGVAGVELSQGGQIRTSIVVHAMDAHRVFMEAIGPQNLDVEFQHLLRAGAPKISTARLHLKLNGVASDNETAVDCSKRLVFAPRCASLRKSFIDARAGRVPSTLIIEAIFPDIIEGASADDETQIVSAFAHPLPFNADPDDAFRKATEDAVVMNLEYIAPGIRGRIEASDLRLCTDLSIETGVHKSAYAAPPNVLRQWARANSLASASSIGGLFFCGPEAQIATGLSCAAGRRAARAAIDYARKGGGRP